MNPRVVVPPSESVMPCEPVCSIQARIMNAANVSVIVIQSGKRKSRKGSRKTVRSIQNLRNSTSVLQYSNSLPEQHMDIIQRKSLLFAELYSLLCAFSSFRIALSSSPAIALPLFQSTVTGLKKLSLLCLNFFSASFSSFAPLITLEMPPLPT